MTDLRIMTFSFSAWRDNPRSWSLRKALNIGLAVVVDHCRRLVLEGYRRFGDTGHRLQALFDDERTVRAEHILHDR